MTRLTDDDIRAAVSPARLRRVVIETAMDKQIGVIVAGALSPSRAAARGIIPDVALVCNDGWTLGARFCDRTAALKLWAAQWVAQVNLHDGTITRLTAVIAGEEKS